MQEASKPYLGRIQALRFFAAFGVLVGHVQHEVAERLMPGVPFQRITFIDGGIGVDIFFLISGFIMYHTAASQFGRPGAAALFGMRRFFRVAPLYYAATILLMLIMMTSPGSINSGGSTGLHILTSFLFIPYPDASGAIIPVLKLGWTLNYEAFFYVIFTLVLMFPARLGLTLLFGGLACVVTAAFAFHGRSVALDFWGNSIVLEFLAGVLVSMAFRNDVRLRLSTSIVLIAGGVMLAVALRTTGLTASLPRLIFHGLPAALIVAGVALGPLDRRRGSVLRALEVGGDASYALYLFHPFAIRATTVAWARLNGPSTPWLFCAIVVLTALIGSVAINLCVEKPFDLWLRRRWGQNKGSIPAAELPL